VSDVVDQSASRAKTRALSFRILLLCLVRVAGFAIAIWAANYGLRLRNDIWTWSAPIRFTGDIGNGLNQGSGVLREAAMLATADGKQISNLQVPTTYLLRGFFDRYDTIVERAHNDQYNLDYTPARLLIMTFWARYVHRVDPSGARFAWEDAAPLLNLNTGCDTAAAIVMFLLVRHWVRRANGASRELAWVLGLIASLISWFNPSTLADAHIWPQWDVWIVPFYLAAMYLASIEWWFAAGVSAAIGAMFKGQVMMVAPVLVLWPLFGGKWSAVARMIIGFLFAAAIAASPWLARNPQSWRWIGSVLLLSAALIAIGRFSRPARRRRWPIWSAIPIIAFVVRACGLSNQPAIALAVAVAITPFLARWLSWLGSFVWLSAIATACIVVSASAFSGSWSWLIVGFAYPTHHYMEMNIGGSGNLAAILAQYYGWHVEDIVGQIGKWPITMKMLLITIYAVALALCAIGASVYDRRNDARVLISLTAPWVLMFTLLPQMHERYLMWAAAVCGVAVASSLGMSLMHLVIIGLSVISISPDLLNRDPNFLPPLFRFIQPMSPGIGWMLLLAAAIYLFVAAVPVKQAFLKSTGRVASC
jgi:hypothetical protein